MRLNSLSRDVVFPDKMKTLWAAWHEEEGRKTLSGIAKGTAAHGFSIFDSQKLSSYYDG